MASPDANNLARRMIRVLVAAAILAGLGAYVWHARHDLGRIFHLDVKYLLPMAAVPILSLAVNGWVGRELAAEFGVKLSAVEWYGLAVVNSVGNYLPLPQAGAAARGVYLKRVHALPYGAYAATLVVTYVSAIALYGVLGLAGLIVLAAMGRPTPAMLWLIFAGLAGSMVLFTPVARLLPLPKKLAGIGEGLRVLRRHHLLAKVIVLQAVVVGLTTTGLWLACRTMPEGRGVSWPTAGMLGLMVLASGIINVTPGNIGVEQGAAELTARLLHVPVNVGFLASAVFRALSVVVVLAIAPAFTAILARKEGG